MDTAATSSAFLVIAVLLGREIVGAAGKQIYQRIWGQPVARGEQAEAEEKARMLHLEAERDRKLDRMLEKMTQVESDVRVMTERHSVTSGVITGLKERIDKGLENHAGRIERIEGDQRESKTLVGELRTLVTAMVADKHRRPAK